jgi:hypothetical protein
VCPASQDRPTPLDRKEHNEKDTNNRSQLQSSCLAARTEAVAMASCLKVNSNIPNEHQSIKTARGTYERIIMRASFMEVTLHNKREKRIRLYFTFLQANIVAQLKQSDVQYDVENSCDGAFHV